MFQQIRQTHQGTFAIFGEGLSGHNEYCFAHKAEAK